VPITVFSDTTYELSGWGDLNSRPSVPQTGRAEPKLLHTVRKPRHDTIPDAGYRCRSTASGPDPGRNVTRDVTQPGQSPRDLRRSKQAVTCGL